MTANPPLDFLNNILTDPAWFRLVLLLRWGFLIGCTVLLFRFSEDRSRVLPPKGSVFLSRIWFFLGLVLLVLIGVKQAQWQLMGRKNDSFVAFMQRYDRREFNPAHRVRSGKILDRNGEPLVYSPLRDRKFRRQYRFGPVTSHALGYNHPVYGLTGIEAAARKTLLGQELDSKEDWFALGAEMLNRENYTEGPPLYTTLDINLQLKASELLGDHKGAVVVMDVKTGAILSMVSHPAYDPNRLYGGLFTGKQSGAPLLNRAIAGQYPPGSVFKVLIAAAALQNGFKGLLDTPPEGFTTSAANPRIRDHEYYSLQEKGKSWKGHGRIDLAQALAKSSNVFFAQLGVNTGARKLLNACESIGMNQPFSLWQGEEMTLQVKPAYIPELKDSQSYEIAQFSIGQGELLVSPLQVAMICAAVANEGLAVQPTLDPERFGIPLGRLCTPQTADQLKWMMYKVVQEGTGKGMRMAELPVAAKTGTAQVGGGQASHAWFAGFAPVSEPRWAFCVLVENGGYGSATALPIARELFQSGIREGWLRP